MKGSRTITAPGKITETLLVLVEGENSSKVLLNTSELTEDFVAIMEGRELQKTLSLIVKEENSSMALLESVSKK